jgi:hypothetical protein
MAQRIGGIGMGLSLPTFLYPSQLYNTTPDIGENRLDLSAGAAWAIEPGDWLLDTGSFAMFQYRDPYTNGWSTFNTNRNGPFHIFSDGTQSLRLANLLGCPIAAVIQNAGSSFTQATATITASTGGSTWNAIVGGALSVVSITAAGSAFAVNPLVLLPGPPTYSANSIGGIPALATVATLTSQTVATVSLAQPGAGYTAATITGLIVPSLFDPNIGTIVPGTVTFGLTDSGKITGAVCTNNGAPLATLTALTLTAAGGAGSGATLTPLVLQTVASASIVAAGVGWGSATSPPKILSVGGQPTVTSAIGNTTVELTGFKPRDVNIIGGATSSLTSLVIIDSGLFVGLPTAAVVSGGTLPTTLASVTFTMGTVSDTCLVQPL